MGKLIFLCGTNYPTSICFIVVNEFCERFSYYGMKAVLTLYFLSYLKWDKNLSTAVYHAFSGLCYFTPILGAVIADSWLGKFKTIIYLSIVYVIGHVVKSVGAIPTVGNTDVHIGLSMFGLILIALGTGGIKPCVAAFGGDQFEEEHIKERQKFFSIFYMSINAGSVLSTLITPILRGDVKCFGDDCYALAFGVPAALMVVALAVFIFGSGMYKKTPPQGNVLGEVCKCIGFAIKNRWNSSKDDVKRKHWLDWAEDKYSKRLIQEIKMVLRVLVLYIPLPMFWALFDQQGSRWTLQATRMNMAFVSPSFSRHLNMLNALLILVFVPIFDLIIYPLPLGVEGNTIINSIFCLNLCKLQDPSTYEPLPLGAPNKELSIDVTFTGRSYSCRHEFEERKAYSLIVHQKAPGIECKLVEDYIIKNEDGNPNVRFFNTFPEAMNVTVGETEFYVPPDYSMSANSAVNRGSYPAVRCSHQSKKSENLNLGLLDFGASYTFILREKDGKIVAEKMEDVKANNVHIAWQIPQYALITAGEVMFSITGLEFSYSQAPNNMKSVLQAGWLLTVAFGNVIVLIVAEGAGLEQVFFSLFTTFCVSFPQWKEFLLFGGLLLGVCIIFSFMAYFYTYVDPEQLSKMYAGDSGKKECEEEEDDCDNTKKKEKRDVIPLTEKGRSTKL
uniref:Solute carrier family 15 member 2 n=1 Tax=Xiphophorus maculatus TaxID=8083 RepID=M3ZFB3_XIPMA